MSENITDAELAEKCPGLEKWEINVIKEVRFYVEGVCLPIVAVLGIIFNLLSSVILGKFYPIQAILVTAAIIKIAVFYQYTEGKMYFRCLKKISSSFDFNLPLSIHQCPNPKQTSRTT